MKIEAQHRELARAPEVPLLRAYDASGLPNWVFGLLCGALVFFLLLLPALLVLDERVRQEVLGTALFFGAIFFVLTAFTMPVYREAARDLRALAPILPLSSADIDCLARGLTRASRKQVAIGAFSGFAIGVLHSFILGHQHLPIAFLIPQATATLSLWVVMFTTLAKLVINAALFSRLGAIAEPDLLRPSRYAPFGSAALRPGLFLIGTLCAYPLLIIGDGNALDDGVWFGVLASLLSLFGIVALPLRGIRDRIRQRRTAILKALDERLEALSGDDLGAVSADTLRDMDTILDMRERVSRAPAWPVDLAGVKRILLYVVLPPLTWAAAAIVEMLIDSAV